MIPYREKLMPRMRRMVGRMRNRLRKVKRCRVGATELYTRGRIDDSIVVARKQTMTARAGRPAARPDMSFFGDACLILSQVFHTLPV